jgi:NAD(P)-dependent dehydrogenase (short-subunit alcohol dehydrogenase family)
VRIEGSVTLVTGASSGIGLATARELARRGAHLVVAARRVDRLRALVDELEKATGRAHLAVEADVARRENVERLVRETVERFGRIDVLVNNAGTGRGDDVLDSQDADLEGLVATNLLAPVRLIRASAPHMPRGGVVVNVGSVAGEGPGVGLYAATKVALRALSHGLRALSHGLRPRLAARGIAVVLVEPGFIRTAMTTDVRVPMPGPELVARAIAHAVERPRRTIVVPWYYRPLIWLMRLTPGPVVDRVTLTTWRWRNRRRRAG